MKKIILVLIAVLIYGIVYSQNYCDSVRKHCTILNANFLLNRASEKHTEKMTVYEYTKDSYDPQTFTIELFFIYKIEKTSIPMDEVINDIWLLVSKQPNGEKGFLSAINGNIFPSWDGYTSFVTIVGWDNVHKKWMIGTAQPKQYDSSPVKGARLITKSKK